MLRKILRRTVKVVFTFFIILTMIGVIQLRIDVDRLSIIFNQKINYLTERYNQSVDNDIKLLEQLQEEIRKNEKSDKILLEKITNLINTINELKENKVDVNKLLNSNVFVMGIFGQGAGTVIKKTDNNMYILTCAHVVEEIIALNKKGLKFGASIGYSKTDNRNSIAGMIVYGAEIIKYDEDNDLALLKTSIVDDTLIAIKIANKEPQKGDVIYSIGSPLGLLRTISKGIIANKIEGFYVSDNVITFGNSGGGLYNDKGELVGVPARVFGYEVKKKKDEPKPEPKHEPKFVPESSLGMSIDLITIINFLRGEI